MHLNSFLITLLLACYVEGNPQNLLDESDSINLQFDNLESTDANPNENFPSYDPDDTQEIASTAIQSEPARGEGTIIEVPPDALPTEGICPAPDYTTMPRVPQRHLACCVIFRRRRKLPGPKGEGVGRDCFWITKEKRCPPLNAHCCKNIINPTPDKKDTTIGDECVDYIKFPSEYEIQQSPSVQNSEPLKKGMCRLRGGKYKRIEPGQTEEC